MKRIIMTIPEESSNQPEQTDTTTALHELGWDEKQENAFSRYTGPYIPGRVASRHKTVFDVLLPDETVRVGTSGALRRLGKVPAVGDFVVLLDQPETGSRMIVDILPRRSTLSRGAPGDGGSCQVIAANLDTVFIVTAAGRDFNLRRLERYLAVVHASGARPVIVINKSDVAEDADALVEETAAIAGDTPVVLTSAREGSGLAALGPFLSAGTTVALVGSSGVGKSTLINALLDDTVQETFDVRDYDERGRHTTTVRQLFSLPCGAMVIDNPGVREIQLGNAAAGLAETFADIAEFATDCRYRDCRHDGEPGCAVQEAVNAGLIPEERLLSYQRLVKEADFQAEKDDIGLKRLEKKKYKWIGKAAKQLNKEKGR
ncbi:ribosome small subunit-dependent GTPase A [Methanogenium sp. S4BF]|uniref:ribosome small subunit-dependent GTPase A n=1 Tax=Methanogenium sp. S4BF TaxID=1789226 RepID=UPI002417A17F|nr:ribosome small subunit-dependent GTPase A [Methanogenium sp. S4BF]WFN33732.1 ribosome small subunit-dependent GTPase A [Methanogenium sp. S4BF]